MKRIVFEPSFTAWRRVARTLLQAGVEPQEIEWVEFDTAAVEDHADVAPTLALTISRELLHRLRIAACYRTPDRWTLLYRVLWRWTHGELSVVNLDDPDGALLDRRVQEVDDETALVYSLTRFRRREPSMGPPEFVGWFEPNHDVLERAALNFAPRMGESTWMLATPHAAAFWNGMLLRIGTPAGTVVPVAPVAPDPDMNRLALIGEAVTSEQSEALWLAHYAHTFASEASPLRLQYWRKPAAGPSLPPALARARTRLDAQRAPVGVPPAPPVVHLAMTPPLRTPTGPLDTCRRCALWRNATQAVAGSGSTHAAIMVVGEQPGEQDDREGEPFTGPAGQLLDDVLARAGLDRAALYLTQAVKHYKWEKPGTRRIHRTPAPREVEACQYWLDRELAQIAPRVVVTLGATALKALTGPHITLSEYLGQTIRHDGRLIVPTYHPAYALRTDDVPLRDDIVATLIDAFKRAARLAHEA